jgi:WD40 repeat protein
VQAAGKCWVIVAALGLLVTASLPAQESKADARPISSDRKGGLSRRVPSKSDGNTLPADALARLGPADVSKEKRNEADPVTSVSFSPSGRLFFSGEYGTIRSWQTSTQKQLHRFTSDDGIGWTFAVSPDERYISSGTWGIEVWETATGKLLRNFGNQRARIVTVAFSPDGQTLLFGDRYGVVCAWEFPAAKLVRRVQLRNEGLGYGEIVPEEFSPDRSLVVTLGHDWQHGGCFGPLRIWDVATGQELREIMEGIVARQSVTFSPDGKMLTSADGTDIIYLWEVATGRELRRLPYRHRERCPVAFSPDGKMLAAGSQQVRQLRKDEDPPRYPWEPPPSEEGPQVIRLWEIATGEIRQEFIGHNDAVSCLTFSPDGNILASGSSDGSTLLWSVTVPAREGRRVLTRRQPEELTRLWGEISSANGTKAFRAMRGVVAASDDAVLLLSKQLRPTPRIDVRYVNQLIANLESGQFKVREQARREIEQMEGMARPGMLQALKRRPSLEVRRRLERLVKRLDQTTPAQVLALRATEVLEHIGTPAARELLRRLATGAPEAHLTLEAQASLKRLARLSVRP